jgi:hypothetical protein
MSGGGIFIIVLFGILVIAGVSRAVSDRNAKKDKQT